MEDNWVLVRSLWPSNAHSQRVSSSFNIHLEVNSSVMHFFKAKERERMRRAKPLFVVSFSPTSREFNKSNLTWSQQSVESVLGGLKIASVRKKFLNAHGTTMLISRSFWPLFKKVSIALVSKKVSIELKRKIFACWLARARRCLKTNLATVTRTSSNKVAIRYPCKSSERQKSF